MQVIILAAGRGSRLGPHSESSPKCLTPLCGRAWLDWQLDALLAAGATSATLVSGHAAEMLEPRPAIAHIVHHANWAATGPVASLYAALDPGDDERELLIAYADCLWHPEWIVRLREAASGIAISSDLAWSLLWRERFADPLADAESLVLRPLAIDTRERWALREIGARVRDQSAIDGQFMGLLRVCGSARMLLRTHLGSLPEEALERLDMTALLSMLVATGEDIEVVSGAGAWIELDHASDLALYERMSTAAAWPHDWRQPPRWLPRTPRQRAA